MQQVLLLSIFWGFTLTLSSQSYGWVHQLASPSMDFSNNVLIDDEGNVYSTGFYRGGEFEVGGETLSFVDNMDSYLARYQADGQLDWVIPLYGKGVFDRTEGLALDGDNLYVLSAIQEVFNIGDQAMVTIDSLRLNDILLMQFNTSGELQWYQTFGGPSSDLAYNMLLRDNDILLAGHFNDSLYFGKDVVVAQNDRQDMFLASVNLDGEAQWIKSYGGPDHDRLYQIAEHGNGDLAICGYTDDTWTFGATTLEETGARDMFVGRIDSNGNPLWAVQMDAGGNTNAEAQAIACDDAGNTYLASSFQHNITVGNVMIENAGGYQMLVARLGGNGDPDWVHASSSQGNEGGSGLYDIIFRDNRLIATGALAAGNAVFGETYDDIANLDFCVAVLDTDGNTELFLHDGGSGFQTGFGIDMNASNTMACAIWGDEGVELGSNNYTGVGYDIFLATIDLSDVLSAGHHVYTNHALEVYPNPVSDVLQVQHGDVQYIRLRILDIRGQVCIEVTDESSIDVSRLPSGSYFLHATGEHEQWVRKIEVMH